MGSLWTLPPNPRNQAPKTCGRHSSDVGSYTQRDIITILRSETPQLMSKYGGACGDWSISELHVFISITLVAMDMVGCDPVGQALPLNRMECTSTVHVQLRVAAASWCNTYVLSEVSARRGWNIHFLKKEWMKRLCERYSPPTIKRL